MPNTASSYDKISRWNHWIVAIVVITLLVIGLYFHEMPRGEEKLFWLRLHISIGATAWLIVIFRVFWRLKQGFLAPMEQPGWQQLAAKTGHWLLLLLILCMFISGPLTIWSAGRDISIFGLINIPSPVERMHELHEWLEWFHATAARIFMWLIGLHVAAAFYHLIKHRQAIWSRMFGQ